MAHDEFDLQRNESALNPNVNQQMASFYNSPMGAYGSSIMHLTNPEQEIYKMELLFKGQVMDNNGTVRQVSYPLMNERGILAITGQVQAIVNQVTIMSNLSQDNLENVMKYQFIYTLVKDLMLNEISYQIGIREEVLQDGSVYYYYDKAARDKVLAIALETAFICAKRAYEGDDKRFWKGTQHENIVRTEGGGANKGISSILSFWKK